MSEIMPLFVAESALYEGEMGAAMFAVIVDGVEWGFRFAGWPGFPPQPTFAKSRNDQLSRVRACVFKVYSSQKVKEHLHKVLLNVF